MKFGVLMHIGPLDHTGHKNSNFKKFSMVNGHYLENEKSLSMCINNDKYG